MGLDFLGFPIDVLLIFSGFLLIVYSSPCLYSVDYERNRTSPFVVAHEHTLQIIEDFHKYYVFVRKSIGNP